jgi:formate dehydrogenase maturation protein FdhE
MNKDDPKLLNLMEITRLSGRLEGYVNTKGPAERVAAHADIVRAAALIVTLKQLFDLGQGQIDDLKAEMANARAEAAQDLDAKAREIEKKWQVKVDELKEGVRARDVDREAQAQTIKQLRQQVEVHQGASKQGSES